MRITQAQCGAAGVPLNCFDTSCKFRDGWCIKNIPKREMNSETCPQTRKHLGYSEGVCAEREKVVVYPNFIELQEIRPGRGQFPLEVRAG